MDAAGKLFQSADKIFRFKTPGAPASVPALNG